MKFYIPGIIIALTVILGGIYIYKTSPGDSGGIACTMEAKICPDGSAVGRTGPKCEFAECPLPVLPQATSTMIRTTIGQKVSGLDVSLTPLEVTGDSRCPTDVQCIWAGTVKVRTRVKSGLGESTMVFELGKPITTEAEEVTLTEVLPQPKAGVKIKDSDYVFQFEVKKREGDKSDKIKLTSPLPGAVIKSPLTVKGEARGSWFFEASFPVILTNWDGLIIAEGIATAEGDWMTTEFVPFTARLEFKIPEYKNNGFLILKKDNPSGLPEYDDALEIPVLFSR